MTEIPRPSEFEHSDNPERVEMESPHVQRLSSIAKQGLELLPERNEPLEVAMFYGAHSTPEDLGCYSEELEKSNFVAIESIAWTKLVNERQKLLIQGDPSVELQPIEPGKKRSFAYAQMELLAGSHKGLITVDVPDGNALVEENREVNARRLQIIKADSPTPKTMSFEDMLTELGDVVQEHARVQGEREAYMVRRLFTELRTVPQEETVKLLWSIGSSHTAIFHALHSEMGDASRRIFAFQKPMVYSNYVEAMRRAMFGKKNDNELLSRAWLGDNLPFDKLMPKSDLDRIDLKDYYERQVTGRYSMDEIEAIYLDVASGKTFEDAFLVTAAEKVSHPPK